MAKSRIAPDSHRPHRTSILVAAILVVITLAVFWRVTGHRFINYDDNAYVTENNHVQAGLTLKSIAWAFTSTHAANWHPLTWISHMADVSLYGLNPAGHHVTNLILHILNTLLLFLVLLRLTANPVSPSPPHPLTPSSAWKCAFVATLFAIHPLHVESVAWIAERKDVLSTFFFLLTILAYARYVEHPGLKAYVPVVLALGLGLMAKPMLVTLPFVLLLLDYWPLGRLKPSAVSNQQSAVSPDPPSPVAASRTGEGARGSFRTPETRNPKPGTRKANTQHRTPNTGGSTSKSRSNSRRLLIEKIPLVLLAAGSCVVTFIVQRGGGAVTPLQEVPVHLRIGNALVTYITYVAQMLWPAHLSVIYPHPGKALPAWLVLLSALLLVAITVLMLLAGRNRRYLAVGWLWYLGTLVPVIGLVQVGLQAMADRYTYVPLIGLFLMIAWGVPDLLRRGRGESSTSSIQHRTSNVRMPAVGKPLTINHQPSTINHSGEQTPDTQNPKPNTLSLSPSLPLGLAVLAILSVLTWQQVGHWRNSETLFQHAINTTQDNYLAYMYLGNVLVEEGKYDEAVTYYMRALRISKDYAEAHNNLGLALGKQGKISEAVREFQEAVRLKPNHPPAQYNLAFALARQGKLREAAVHYRESVRAMPDYAKAHKGLAVVLFYTGDYAGAWQAVHDCEKYGGTPHPAFIEALSQKMADPGAE